MAEKNNMYGRVQNKHDTEANWLKATNFIPKAGEIIVYDPDDTYTYARIKIGDGTTLVNNLSFVNTMLSDDTPLIDGEATSGVSDYAARADHVHPTDTTRMPAISEMSTLTSPADNDRFPLYDYDVSVMKYIPWGRIKTLIKNSIGTVSEAQTSSYARSIISPEGDVDIYATLPEGMTDIGVLVLQSDLNGYYSKTEDKDELVSEVLSALPTWEGGSY